MDKPCCIQIVKLPPSVSAKLADQLPIVDISEDCKNRKVNIQTILDFIEKRFGLTPGGNSPKIPPFLPQPTPSPVPTPEITSTISQWVIAGNWLIEDGGKYAFGVQLPAPVSAHFTFERAAAGGSNSVAAMVGGIEPNTTFGASYTSNCRASMCGVIGYEIITLVPIYEDGSSGANQASGQPLTKPPGQYQVAAFNT